MFSAFICLSIFSVSLMSLVLHLPNQNTESGSFDNAPFSTTLITTHLYVRPLTKTIIPPAA